MDLLGFGLSEKALIEYNANVWRDQVGDFLKEVVGKPAVLAGNRYLFFFAISFQACIMFFELFDNFDHTLRQVIAPILLVGFKGMYPLRSQKWTVQVTLVPPSPSKVCNLGRSYLNLSFLFCETHMTRLDRVVGEPI
jgi:hypothetical protein